MHSAKRMGLALAIVSAGWLAASAFRTTGLSPLSIPVREVPIRREFPLHLRSNVDRSKGPAAPFPAAALESGLADEFPRLDRVPRIGQLKSE